MKVDELKSDQERPCVRNYKGDLVTLNPSDSSCSGRHIGVTGAVLMAFLAIAVMAAFSPVVRNGFISFDDDTTLLRNNHVNRGLSVDSLRWAFTSGEYGNWQPLTWISHMIDFQLFADHAAGHHIMSVLMHVASAILLAVLLFFLTGSRNRSALVAALFSLHPLRVQSVAWAAERKDVLSLFLGLLSLVAWMQFVRRRSKPAYVSSLSLYAAALMAKPMLVTFPGILLLLDYWPLGRSIRCGSPTPIPQTSLLFEKTPFLLLSAGAGLVTILVQSGVGAVAQSIPYPYSQRAANAILSYSLYITDTLWPAKLAVFYPYWWQSIPWWKPILSFGVIALCTAAALLWVKRRPELFFGWFWYLGTLLPVIGLVQVGSQSRADRYTYLPHIGLFIALVWTFASAIADRPRLRALASMASLALLVVLGTATAFQVTFWRDTVSLFSRAVAVTENNFTAYSILGSALVKIGRKEEGTALIARSFQLNPKYRADVFVRSGDTYADLGMKREAAEYYRKALAILPYNPNILKKLRKIEESLGMSSESRR